MIQTRLDRFEFVQGADMTRVARVVTPKGTILLSSGDAIVTAITLKVFDIDDSAPDTDIYTGAVDPAQVLAALSTDEWWQGKDGTGYNFRHTIDAGDLTGVQGDHSYLFEYEFATTNYGLIYDRSIGTAIGLYGG